MNRALVLALMLLPWICVAQVQPGYSPNTVQYGATQGGNNTNALNKTLSVALSYGGGVAKIPGGYGGTFTYSFPDPTVVEEFDGPNINRSMLGFGSAATDSGKVFSGVLGTTRPSSNNRALVSFWGYSQGSGANGANHGDFIGSYYEQKINWNCTTARFNASSCTTVALAGENDVLSLTSFQGGPDAGTGGPQSTAGLIAGSVNCVDGVGDCLPVELQTYIYDPLTLAIIRNIDVQIGGTKNVAGDNSSGGYGLVLNANIGVFNAALRASGSDSSDRWGLFEENIYNGGINYQVTDQGVPTFSGGEYAVNIGGWATSTAYVYGSMVTNAGNVYRCVNVGGTSSVAPTVTSGVTTGADSITWMFLNALGTPQIIDVTGGTTKSTETFLFRAYSSTGTQIDLPQFAGYGNPGSVVTSVQGADYMRTDGGPSRTLYVKESGGSTPGVSGWDSVLTSSTQNALTATGSTQGGAYAIAARLSIFTTVASNTGAALNSAIPDAQMVVNNSANALSLYPPSGASGQINGLGTNAALFVNPGGAITCEVASAVQWYCSTALLGNAPALGLSIPTGTATFSGGTGITSVVCASGYSCNNTRGTLTVVGGTATTGTIATVTFSATLSAAPACFASMNGGATVFSIGNSAPTASAFNITAGISVIGATFNVNYVCQP